MSAATSTDGRIRWDDEQYSKIHSYIVDQCSANGYWPHSNIYVTANKIKGVKSACDLIRQAQQAVIPPGCHRPMLRGNFNAQQIWDMAMTANGRLAGSRDYSQAPGHIAPATVVDLPSAALNTLKLTREEAIKMIPHLVQGTLIELV